MILITIGLFQEIPHKKTQTFNFARLLYKTGYRLIVTQKKTLNAKNIINMCQYGQSF